MKMHDISVIVPVYRGEHTVKALFAAIQSTLQSNYDFEVIFVNDCGPDNSLAVLAELEQTHPERIRVLRLSRNFGQHNAIICGCAHATGRLIVTMDEDLQHDPADIIPLLTKQAEQNFDVVYGDYDSDRRHSGIRNSLSRVMKNMLARAIPELHPHYSAFRVIRAPVAKAMVEMRNSYTFLDGYLAWLTTHVASVPVPHHDRFGGESSYTIPRLIEHAINVFVTFSNYPIRLLVRASFSLFLTAAIFSLYVAIRKFLTPDQIAIGYSSLIIASTLGTGAILLGLGIIGEYLHRINQKTTRRPNYFLRAGASDIDNLIPERPCGSDASQALETSATPPPKEDNQTEHSIANFTSFSRRIHQS